MTDKRPYPSETAEKVLLRLPEGMRDRLAGVAKRNGRSMNAEIVARLEASLAAPSADEPLEVIVERASRSAVLSAISTIFDGMTDAKEKVRVLRKLKKPGAFTITHGIKEPEKP